MKIYKKAVLAVSIFAMAAGAAMTSAGAQETYLPPVMVQGTVSEKTETRYMHTRGRLLWQAFRLRRQHP